MYCVKCGVKLLNNPETCPLCGTPAWNPDGAPAEKPRFSEEMPASRTDVRRVMAAILTGLSCAALVAVFTVAVSLSGSSGWSGYVLLGIVLGYISFFLPLWFKKPLPEVHIPVAHACAAVYTLYVNIKTGGSWFLPFALPVTLISCVLLTALFTLLEYIKQRQGFILGGFLILTGGATMLLEFFEHIAFGNELFRWSLYSCGACVFTGIVVLLCEIIRPLNAYIKKNFFY